MESRETGLGEQQDFGRVVPALLILMGIFLLNFLSRIILGPMLPTLEADLGLTHAEAGALFIPITLGYFTTLMGSGFIAARLGHRRTIICSACAVGGAMLLAAAAPGLWGLRLGMLLLGLAAGPYLPSGLATLTGLVKPDHWGKAVAVHELAPNVSFVAAPLVAMGLLALLPWRGVLAVLGLASLGWGFFFSRRGQGGYFPGLAPNLGSLSTLARQPSFWIMMFLFCVGVGGSLGVYSMMPLYLVSERHMDQETANLWVSLSRLTGLGAAFVAGWASDRLGPKRAVTGVLVLAGLATLGLGLTSGGWLLFFLFLQPMLAVCFFPPAFASLSRVGPAESRSVTVSLTLPPAFLAGGGLLPTAMGWTAEHLSFGWGIGLFGVLTLAAVLLVGRLELGPRPGAR